MFRLGGAFRSTIRLSHKAFNIVRSSELDDEEKEARVRLATMEILKITISFVLKLVSISLVLYVVYILARFWFPVSAEELIDKSFSPYTITGLILGALLYGWLRSAIIQRLQSR